ncbi:hypothetical protein BTZ20_4715 [Rhodococcus sp. MTM3W5.2]|nr:hypothetical protein BTZ20_4715 [Rhodococcus sp. MTM3W5.2]
MAVTTSRYERSANSARVWPNRHLPCCGPRSRFETSDRGHRGTPRGSFPRVRVALGSPPRRDAERPS